MNYLNDLNGLNFWNHLIIGFGSLAKVLEPASLVKEIKDDLGKSLKSYARPYGHRLEKIQKHVTRFDKHLWYEEGLFLGTKGQAKATVNHWRERRR